MQKDVHEGVHSLPTSNYARKCGAGTTTRGSPPPRVLRGNREGCSRCANAFVIKNSVHRGRPPLEKDRGHLAPELQSGLAGCGIHVLEKKENKDAPDSDKGSGEPIRQDVPMRLRHQCIDPVMDLT